jgi:hypothetical protein
MESNAGEEGKQTELKLYYKSLLSKRHDIQGRRDGIGKPGGGGGRAGPPRRARPEGMD